jgi:predicted transcriptional regulator
MPNIGALLKQEITRLSRKEVRGQVQATKKAASQHRHDIAALKRQIAALQRQVAQLQRTRVATPPAASDGEGGQKVRFVAKGLKSQRSRLGLSAGDYGQLIGVSAQSVYNWEQGHTTPRTPQVRAIAALRGIGKRDAQARLEQLAARRAKRSKKH